MPPAAPDPLHLCLDQGGHASRALVFDSHGALQASAQREVGFSEPGPGRVEQDPEELITSLEEVIAEAVTALGARAGRLVSAGLATQRSSIVCWDRISGAALSPVISWQDRRARDWLAPFHAHQAEVQRRTGLRLSPHYGASKLRWCLDQLPAVAAAQRERRLALGPLASFLLFRLLREQPVIADPANAARTLLWNIRTLDWDPWLLDLFGIPPDALPRCQPSRHGFGTLHVDIHQIPLTIATGDQSAALFASGLPAPDALYLNLGTGAFIQRAFPELRDVPGLLGGLVYRDAQRAVYVAEGTVNGAGAALAWAQREWGLEDIEARLPEWLERDGDVPLFLNGVAGLGAPYWVADFPSRLIGDVQGSTSAAGGRKPGAADGEPWQKAVAVVESIAFLLQANLERLREIPPAPERLLVSGGLARLDALCRRLADLSGLPVYRPAEHEATARGTAFLLTGFPADWPEQKPGETFAPAKNSPLARRYREWRAAMERALDGH